MRAGRARTSLMMNPHARERVLVQSCKYDGSVRREWNACLVEHSDSLIVLEGTFDEEIRHPLLGTIRAGTLSVEYYWTTRWYSVFRFHEPEGPVRNYYCNINTPARLENGRLSYVDLDIDVLVATDFSYTVLDEDEFAQNAVTYAYPQDVQSRARRALAELCAAIEGRQFPFQMR